MYKLFLTTLLVLPAALLAQSSDSQGSSNSGSTASVPAAPQTQTQTSASSRRFGFIPGMGMIFGGDMRDSPVGSLTASYVYVFQDSQYGNNRSLMGWSVVPEVNFTKYLGLQAEFTSLYMRSVYPGQSRFLIAAGPRINLAPHSRVRPFLFAEGGEIRSTTKANDIADWNPVAKGGFGFDYKITRGLSFQLIPGEYMGQYLEATGDWQHNFTTRAGITFNLYR